MNDWFTVKVIDAQTFAISEYQHWEETHCYLICGQEKAFLIDTGLGICNIRSVAHRLTTFAEGSEETAYKDSLQISKGF